MLSDKKSTMYDSITELIEKTHLGEDATIEFKRELPRRSSLADEIAAFANARGGVILIGVDDNGEIIGINRQELDRAERTVVEICQDSIDPILLIFTEKLRIDDKNLLKVEVPRSLFVHKTANGYFIRQGSSKWEMPTDQLARLFQTRLQARIIAFDEQFVPNTGKETLRKDLYQRFITEGAAEDEMEDLLLKRRLLVKEGQEIRASVAGVLMCYEKPDDYLYNSFIQAVVYGGTEKDADRQIDTQDFTGPLDHQVVQTMRFAKRYNAVAARKDIGRVDIP